MKKNIRIYSLFTWRLLILGLLYFAVSTEANAQNKSFAIAVNRDTVLMGNTINVSFTIKNVNGDFEGPEFKEFNIISGPNTTSSMYSVNGETTSTMIYSYLIQPKKEGEFFIENAYLVIGKDKSMETSPRKILVLPNPQGIIEEEESIDIGNTLNFSFPNILEMPGQINPPQMDNKGEGKTTRKIKRI